ncbi:MAG TPA: hypothetical protein VGB85_28715, partial [Nannocystis sp.]
RPGFQIRYEFDAPKKMPVINDKMIRFNGMGDDGHETMMLDREHDPDFRFCKTARKDYDEAVLVLLTLAEHHAPGAWKISSDGEEFEWQPAVDWMNTLGMGDFEVPPGVRQFEE